MARTEFVIETQGPGLTEVTGPVASWVAEQGGSGLLTLLIRHTSAALLIQENADPEVRTDLMAFYGRLVPPADHPAMAYLTHRYEGPDDMPGHILASLLPVSVGIPVASGRMALGTWQGIYLVELRQAPHSRRIAAQFQRDVP